MQAESRKLNGLPAVYVGRPSRWGNPFATADEFRVWIERAGFVLIDRWVRIRLDLWRLRGKNLVCWCPLLDKNGNHHPCHADILLALANKEDH